MQNKEKDKTKQKRTRSIDFEQLKHYLQKLKTKYSKEEKNEK